MPEWVIPFLNPINHKNLSEISSILNFYAYPTRGKCRVLTCMPSHPMLFKGKLLTCMPARQLLALTHSAKATHANIDNNVAQ